MAATVKRWLREPLLHFLLLGAGLFLAYGIAGRGGGNEPQSIVITRGEIENLATGFTRAWQRPPTAEELQGIIADRVREEVYYREALALGLDKDDTVIRRRLRQKMEFVTDDLASAAQPSDDQLDAYLQAHAEAFRSPRSFTFSQVYLNPAKRDAQLARDAVLLLARMNAPGAAIDVAALGDALMLQHSYAAVTEREVAAQFGAGFANALGHIEPGKWQGPIESAYGMHLVRIEQRVEGHAPALANVRDSVLREWTESRRLDANEQFYQALRKRYTVTIEQPPATSAPARLASAR